MNKQSRLLQDLNYKSIRAINIMQTLYRERKHRILRLTARLETIYRVLVSIMNNVSNHFHHDIISKEEYTLSMLKIDEVLTEYEKIPNPITVSTYRSSDLAIEMQISMLEYQTVGLLKRNGASTCEDVLTMLVPNWRLGLGKAFLKLFNFYNAVFVPKTVKISSQEEDQEVVMPLVHKYGSYTESTLLGLHGAELTIPLYRKLVQIKGYFRRDPLNIARVGGTIGEKYQKLLASVSSLPIVSEGFKFKYIQQISLRDFLSLSNEQLTTMVSDSYLELQKLLEQQLSYVIDKFDKSKMENKSKILTLLLLDDEHKYATSLIGSLSGEQSTQLNQVYKYLHWSVQIIFDKLTSHLDTSGADLNASPEDLPYEVRIENMKSSESVKRKASDKLKEIKNSRDGNEKASKYLDALLRIPFGVFKKEKMLRFMGEFKDEIQQLVSKIHELKCPDLLPLSQEIAQLPDSTVKTAHHVDVVVAVIQQHRDILTRIIQEEEQEHENYVVQVAAGFLSLEKKWQLYKEERTQYMNNVKGKLECIYGQKDAKRKVETIIAQWINGEMEGAVFGFRGPPGTGKTSLAKEGLAQCLVDEDGSARPFAFIPLGGSTNGSTLEGHNYTYVGSKWGRIVDVLMETRCMNPIIYFDELDKISHSEHGREIVGILTHLTDPQQNDSFNDRYFDGINIDLSKALIIFSYNDPSLIDEILADRITEVNFKHLVKEEKIHIAEHYMLPKILNSVGYTKNEIVFTNAAIEHIVESYVYEAGVRQLKEKLYEIVREINARILHDEKIHPLPITVDCELVDDILERKNRITAFIKTIPTKPQIGWVNGLFATKNGLGGLTIIQVSETLSEQKFSIEPTGKLGEVMKESIKCAKTIAWKMLPDVVKASLQEEWKTNPFGLHLHCPEASTPKDGPSAGAAITGAVISYLCKMPVRNYIALTGEIDLYGQVHAIGGLQSKVEGAIRAGVKIILIPRENGEEWDDMALNYATKVRVVKVDNISQVLHLLLINDNNYQFNHSYNAQEDVVVQEIWPYVTECDQVLC